MAPRDPFKALMMRRRTLALEPSEDSEDSSSESEDTPILSAPGFTRSVRPSTTKQSGSVSRKTSGIKSIASLSSKEYQEHFQKTAQKAISTHRNLVSQRRSIKILD